MGGVIFDLDQTLIDTSIADNIRKQKQWNQVYSLIPQFTVYPGVIETIHYLRQQQVQVCVVTSSPSTYCNKVISHWGLHVDHTVCFHDTSQRKPHPQPILKALTLMNCQPGNTFSLGDRDIDIQASNSAQVISIACLWGSNNHTSLLSANPSHVLNNSQELLAFFKNQFQRN